MNKAFLFANKVMAVMCDTDDLQQRKIGKKKGSIFLFCMFFLASICRPSSLTLPRILSGIPAAAESFQKTDMLRLTSNHICSDYRINTARNRKGQTGRARSLGCSS